MRSGLGETGGRPPYIEIASIPDSVKHWPVKWDYYTAIYAYQKAHTQLRRASGKVSVAGLATGYQLLDALWRTAKGAGSAQIEFERGP